MNLTVVDALLAVRLSASGETHSHGVTGAGHARSRYLNRKEGGAEGRASDWSEVETR